MSYLLNTLAGNTLVAIALAVMALLALQMHRPALSHVLWVLVMAKLVTPGFVRAPVPAKVVEQWTPAGLIQSAAAAQDRFIPAPKENSSAKRNPLPSEPFHTRADWLAIAWSAGSLGIIMLACVRIARFRKMLRTGKTPGANLRAEIAGAARRVGLSRQPDVCVMDDAVGPMIYFAGFARPLLIVPGQWLASMPADRRMAVLSHELAHLRRRDHWVRIFELLATAALWWHPLIWLAKRGLHESEEQSCDAWVVWAMPDARQAYASALVDAVEYWSSAGKALPPVASGIGKLKHLKRRIIMVVKHKPSRTLSRLAKGVVVIAVLALPIVPGVVHAEDAKPANDPVVVQNLKQYVVDQTIQKLDSQIHDKQQELKQLQERLAIMQAANAADSPKKPEPDQSKIVDAQRAKARSRMRQDSRKYTNKQLQECENLYQEANGNLGAPEANAKLQQVIEKWPDADRAGCAAMYLGQKTQGDEQVKWLKLAMDKYANTFYGDGVQVGAYAHYVLGMAYKDQGKTDDARKVFDELVKKYPDAIDHRGDSLAKAVDDVMPEKK